MAAPANIRDAWATFAAGVESRLAAGAAAYGDRSLSAAPSALVGEVEEELLDVAGWSFVLWMRLRDLRARLPDDGTTRRSTTR